MSTVYTQNAQTEKFTKRPTRASWKSTRDLETFPLPRLWHRLRVKGGYILLHIKMSWKHRAILIPLFRVMRRVRLEVPYSSLAPSSERKEEAWHVSDWPSAQEQQREEEGTPFSIPSTTQPLHIPSGEYVRTWKREYSDKHQTPASATTAALKRIASEEQETQRMPVIPKSLRTVKLTQKDVPYYSPLPLADAEAYRKMGVGITAEGDQFLLDSEEERVTEPRWPAVWPGLDSQAQGSRISG